MEVTIRDNEIIMDDEAMTKSGFDNPITYPDAYNQCSAIHAQERATLLSMTSADDDELLLSERGMIPELRERQEAQAFVLGRASRHFSGRIASDQAESIIGQMESMLLRAEPPTQ